MLGKSLTLSFVAASSLGFVAAGCNRCETCDCFDTSNQRTNRAMDRAQTAPQDHWTDMSDNAMLQDMTVADFHFIPHSAEISGSGQARLDRMGTLLDVYGGTVRYETFESSDDLVKKRLEHVREYLVTTGCDMKRVEIKAMISGGRGMLATKAIIVDIKGTALQSGAASGPSPAVPPARSAPGQ